MASKKKDEGFGVSDLVEGITRRVGSALEIASKTTEYAVGVIQRTPEQMELMGKAGNSLRDMREVAGLTLKDVSDAINLKDEKMLEDIESGRIAVSFEILLRLASLYSRNDPLPFVMKYARTYSPVIWELMRKLGLDKLPLQYEREREFINIYRSRDEARRLSDEGFAKVLDFTRKSFDMALHFVAEQEAQARQAQAEKLPVKTRAKKKAAAKKTSARRKR